MVVWCVVVRPVRQGWSLWTSVTVKSASRELSGVCWPSDGKWEGRLLLSSRGGDDDFSLAEPGAHRRAVLLSTDDARARRARWPVPTTTVHRVPSRAGEAPNAERSVRSRGDAINLESRFPGSNHADPRCRLRLLPSSAFRLHFGTDDGGLLLSMCPSPHSTSHLPPIRALMDDGSWTVDGIEGFESKNTTRRRCSPSASMEGCRSRRCYMQRGRAGLTWLRQ